MVSICVVVVICWVVLFVIINVDILVFLLFLDIGVSLLFCLMIMCVFVLFNLNDDIVVWCGFFVVGYGEFCVGMKNLVDVVLIVGFYCEKCRFGGIVVCCIVSVVLMNFVILVVVFR